MTFEVKDIKADGRKKKIFFVDDNGAFTFLPGGEKSPASDIGWQMYEDNRAAADTWISASAPELT
jgi:hypothetical protein